MIGRTSYTCQCAISMTRLEGISVRLRTVDKIYHKDTHTISPETRASYVVRYSIGFKLNMKYRVC